MTEINDTTCRISRQLDESTYVANCCYLLCFAVDEFFTTNGLSWDFVGSNCTNGVPAVISHNSGFAAHVKKRVPDALISLHHPSICHCIENTATPLARGLNKDCAGRKFYSRKGCKSTLLKSLCDELGSTRDILLHHTEVRWLSEGRVCNKVCELVE